MLDWILSKLSDRLGVAPAGSAEKLQRRIVFEQPSPQWVYVFTILGSFALIVWLYRNEGKASTASKIVLATLRFSLVLLALFMLSEAVLSVQRTGMPNLAILVDDSASEAIVDQYATARDREALTALADAAVRPGPAGDPKKKEEAPEPAPDAAPTGPNRLEIAKGIILQDRARLLRALQGKYRVRIYRVSNSTQPIAEVDKARDVAAAVDKVRDLEPSGTQTRLGDGVRQVITELRGSPPSAIVVLTDGQTTEGEPLTKASELAARKNVPLYAVGLGSPDPARDLELGELLVDDVVFVDDAVRFQAKLTARGFQGQKVTVRLKEREPGSTDPKNDKVIETREVDAPADGQSERVELVHRPRTTGERTFIVEVEPRPRELQTDNNRIERMITIRKEKLRVLYVDNEPRYEFRYLKNYLERDESIELGVVLLSSDPEYSEQDRSAMPTFPASKEELFSYDVVLIGDADTSYLSQSQMQNLVEFVTEKGGGVLFVAGELFNPIGYRGTPLELLLPVELADARNPTAVGAGVAAYRPELTVEGRCQPDLPPGRQRGGEHEYLEPLARAVLVLRGSAEEAGGLGAGRASDRGRIGREGSADRLPVPRLGEGDVPRVRRHLAVAVPGGGSLLRPVLGPDDPVHGPIAAGRQSPGGDPDRPPSLPARAADPASGAVPQPGPGPGRRRGVGAGPAAGTGAAPADAPASARIERPVRGRAARRPRRANTRCG